MARTYTCDFCGELIENDGLMVKLKADGYEEDPERVVFSNRLVLADVGYYHATDERACWAEMLDRLGLIHDVSANLGLSVEEVERRREQRAGRQLQEEERQRANAAHDAARDAWRGCSWDDRERLLFEALGDSSLTTRELAERLSERLGASAEDRRWPVIHTGHVQAVTMRMLLTGQLDRVKEGSYRGRPVWQWYRNRTRELDGPIVDLEATYHAEAKEEDR